MCRRCSGFKEPIKTTFSCAWGWNWDFSPIWAPGCLPMWKPIPLILSLAPPHVSRHLDPYEPEFFQGITEREAYRTYFEEELENLRRFDCFDVAGHLDYVHAATEKPEEIRIPWMPMETSWKKSCGLSLIKGKDWSVTPPDSVPTAVFPTPALPFSFATGKWAVKF